jgi:hypothetical protein
MAMMIRFCASTLEAIQRAFDEAGVVFLDVGDVRPGGGVVRLKGNAT